MLARAKPFGNPLDQCPAAPVSVMRIVDDERAGLLGQRAEQQVDRAGRVVAGLGHGGRRAGETGLRHRGAQPGGEQPGRGTALVQRDFDADRPPGVHQFGRQHGLAVAGRRLGQHHAGLQARPGQPGARDMVRRQTSQLQPPAPWPRRSAAEITPAGAEVTSVIAGTSWCAGTNGRPRG
ncbi:MAG TPA: hypothetical protein VGM53_20915 [Streptosporangiaceae bacterium]